MYSLFIGIQCVGIVILFAEALYVVCQKQSRLQQHLLLLILALCINFVGYLLELQAKTQAEALIAVKMLYLGKPFIALALFLIAMQMCRVKVPGFVEKLLLGIHIMVLVLVLTCEKHTLFYSSIRYTQEGIFPHLVLGHGIAYNLYSMLLVFYAVAMIVECMLYSRKTHNVLEKNQVKYIVVISFVAVTGFLVYLSGITQGYDITLLAYLIDTVLLSFLIFKEQIIDTLALAKDLAIDVLGEGLVVVDNEEKVIYFNQKAKQIYHDIDVGKCEEILEAMDECILEKEKIMCENSVYAASSRMIEQNNIYYGKMYVLSDITDSYHYTRHVKEQADIMKELKDQAESANQAKSAFVSNMSHEIRTPMNAIVGLTDVLLRRKWSPEEKQYLLNIKSSGGALLNLINDLLDFSKIEAGKFEISKDRYDMAQMLKDIEVIGITRIGDKDVRLVMDVDGEIPRKLYGDSLRIRQVIINIMNNAIKFTEHGSVTVTVRQLKREEQKTELLISVKDTGIGIHSQDLERLFDAFTQVDIKKNRGKEGTGLGLAISKQLVELMGGELSVESEYGKGSNFYFKLWEGIESEEKIGDFGELKESQEDDEADVFSFTAPDAKILLVDDNEINREVAQALLEPLEMKIDAVSNGKEALDMVQKKEYDLVFMDHFMPVMDGVEATKQIRAMDGDYYQNLPIIALTADAVQGVKEQFLACGMNDFISKPIDVKVTCDKIRLWLPDDLICRTE